MAKKKTWLQILMSKPRDKVALNSHHMLEYSSIRGEVERLLGFEAITDDQFNSLIQA